jgi:hypothetical protein
MENCPGKARKKKLIPKVIEGLFYTEFDKDRKVLLSHGK